jgi:hypothetical protein
VPTLEFLYKFIDKPVAFAITGFYNAHRGVGKFRPLIRWDAYPAAANGRGGVYASEEEGPQAGHQVKVKVEEQYEEESRQKEEEVTSQKFSSGI